MRRIPLIYLLNSPCSRVSDDSFNFPLNQLRGYVESSQEINQSWKEAGALVRESVRCLFEYFVNTFYVFACFAVQILLPQVDQIG